MFACWFQPAQTNPETNQRTGRMSLSARPHPITIYGKTTNIYVLVTFCTASWCRPWGRRCTFTLFGHRMAHFSTTFAMASTSDTSRFGSLEFPALPPIRMWIPPISSEAWTSSPIGSAYYTSVRRRLFRRPSKGRPASALGHTMTSTTRHLRFISSKLSA